MSETKGLRGEKILLTGATGQLAYSVARKLARDNSVHAIARFSAEGSRARLEAVGLDCIPFDYVEDDLDRLDRDYDYVLHFATTQIPGDEDFERATQFKSWKINIRISSDFKSIFKELKF